MVGKGEVQQSGFCSSVIGIGRAYAHGMYQPQLSITSSIVKMKDIAQIIQLSVATVIILIEQ